MTFGLETEGQTSKNPSIHRGSQARPTGFEPVTFGSVDRQPQHQDWLCRAKSVVSTRQKLARNSRTARRCQGAPRTGDSGARIWARAHAASAAPPPRSFPWMPAGIPAPAPPSRTGANAEGGASTGHPRPETAGRHGRAGRLPQIGCCHGHRASHRPRRARREARVTRARASARRQPARCRDHLGGLRLGAPG